MPKNVIAILPGDKFDHVVVQDNSEIVTFRGDKGGVLTMPIEEYELSSAGRKGIYAPFSRAASYRCWNVRSCSAISIAGGW